MNASIPNASSLVFYSLPNFAGSSLVAAHGQTGIVASSAASWVERSVSVPGTDGMYTFIWSAVDTGNPAMSYAGHDEQYIKASLPYIENAFPSPQYPLQYLGINASLAVPVFVQLSGNFPAENCLAATALVPGSVNSVTTFASSQHDGALGFIQPVNGASTLVSLMIGTLSDVDGTVQWMSAASLMLVFANNVLTLSAISSLPDGWTFGTPTLQSDGSWLVTLSAGQVSDIGTLYSGVDYTGNSQTLSPHQSLQANSGSGWLWRSVKLSEMSVLLYSSFNPVDAAYDYVGYQLIRMSSDTPDFATLFTGNLPAQLLALDRTDVQIFVNLNTSASDDAVIALTQAYPVAFYSAVTRGNTGLLALLPASGTAQNVAVKAGELNADGSASFSLSGEFSVSLEEGIPVITPGTGIPASWSFSAPIVQADGTWIVTLSDTAVNELTLYSSANYQGDSTQLATGESILLRSPLWQWNWQSARLNGNYLFSHTLLANPDTFDFRTYADSYDTADIADLSTLYPIVTHAAVEGTALNEDEIAIRVVLLPDNTSQAVVAVTLQTMPSGAPLNHLASVGNGLLSVPGVLAVINKKHAPVTLPLQVGKLDTTTGLVTWQVTTTLIAGWNDKNQLPELAFGVDAPDDWVLYPARATGKAGEYRTVFSGNIIAPFITPRGPRGRTFYCNHAILTALDADTLKPVEALWQYEGEIHSEQATCFIDVSPFRPLHVRSGKGRQATILRPGNIAETWDTQVKNNAVAALTDNSTPLAWGDSSHGGSIPSDIASRTDLIYLSGNYAAFAALSKTGSVVAWGKSSYGGSIPTDIASRTDIVSVMSTTTAFAALTASGSVVAWGNTEAGGSVPTDIASQTNLTSLAGSNATFAALTATGGVVAWGGGDGVPDDIASRTNLVSLAANLSAFAALTASGGMVTWGDSSFGGDAPDDYKSRTDLVGVTGNEFAFTALTAGGSVLAWGDAGSGGSLPEDIASRTDIIGVTGSSYAFAALTASGSVVTWGNKDYGEALPDDIASRTDLVSITATAGAFAAITAAGNVVTWGSTSSGATIPDDIASLLTGVVAIYAGTNSFIALKSDNSVVVWGNDYSADMDEIPSSLQGNISYLK